MKWNKSIVCEGRDPLINQLTQINEKREIHTQTYLVYEINGCKNGLIIGRHGFFEGRLKRKGFLHPYTIGEREARTIGRSCIFEEEGKKMRDEGVEMINGFETEEVKKLLLSRTLRASNDDAENNLERQWQKDDVLVWFFWEEMFGDGEGNFRLVGAWFIKVSHCLFLFFFWFFNWKAMRKRETLPWGTQQCSNGNQT